MIKSPSSSRTTRGPLAGTTTPSRTGKRGYLFPLLANVGNPTKKIKGTVIRIRKSICKECILMGRKRGYATVEYVVK
jgi:hypothetical protein